jgi:hypothetical protein
MSELTTEERDELMKLRSRFAELQDKENNATPADSGVGTTLPATHWLHLADGSVVESNGVKSSHDGIQVIGAYEKPSETSSPANEPHVF